MEDEIARSTTHADLEKLFLRESAMLRSALMKVIENENEVWLAVFVNLVMRTLHPRWNGFIDRYWLVDRISFTLVKPAQRALYSPRAQENRWHWSVRLVCSRDIRDLQRLLISCRRTYVLYQLAIRIVYRVILKAMTVEETNPRIESGLISYAS